MNIQLKNVKEIVEVNSTYVKGELHRKFVRFTETMDNMGLKVEDVILDLGRDSEGEEEEIGGILLGVPTEDMMLDVPAVWVLVDDNNELPLFKPIKSDSELIDFDRAVKEYGLDIIVLKTGFTETLRTVRIVFEGETLEKTGTLRVVQQWIIDTFTFPECRYQIFAKLNESFFEKESKHSFLLTIPETKKYISIGISG